MNNVRELQRRRTSPRSNDRRHSISVVVPAYNAASTIITLLESLEKQTCCPLEIIVVDNNSIDDTRSCVERWAARAGSVPIRILCATRQGRTHARNAGIKAARGTHIAFFDADCIVDSRWVEEARRAIDMFEADAIGGVVLGHDPRTVAETLASIMHNPKASGHALAEEIDEWGVMTDAIETCNVLVKVDSIRRVGGFDTEGFPIVGEDFDLFVRLLRSGCRVVARHRGLLVRHVHRATLRQLIVQVWGYGVGFSENVAKHFGGRFTLHRPSWFTMSRSFPLTVWVFPSISTALLLSLSGAALFFPPEIVVILGVSFFGALVALLARRAQALDLKLTALKLLAVAGTALVHWAALRAGLLWGSFRYRLLCF